MTAFSEQSKKFKSLARTARGLADGTRVLEQDALRLARNSAQKELLENLERAITMSKEYSIDMFADRLRKYFSAPERVTVDSEKGVSVNVNAEEARRQWIQAQDYANYIRNTGKTLFGWAANPSPAQRQAYWRNKVWLDEDKWSATIETRLAFLDDMDAAPFWYFLEYGTGPGATPALGPTRFVTLTEAKSGGFKGVNEFLEKMIRDYSTEAAKALEKSYTVGTIEAVRWSKYYTRNGKVYRHRYDSRGRFVAGSKVEVYD